MFSGPGTQMADQHSRMELSDPERKINSHVRVIEIQAAVTSQNLGQDQSRSASVACSLWGGGGDRGALGPQERTA